MDPPASPVATENDIDFDLRDYVRQHRSIPEDRLNERCLPAGDDPNILLVTRKTAFLYDRRRLMRRATAFADKWVSNLSDDSVDVVDDYPVVSLDDAFEHNAGFVYCFLKALTLEDSSPYPLNSVRDYCFLSSILWVFTRYEMNDFRVQAMKTLENLYPADFDLWNEARKRMQQSVYKPNHIEVINLAHSIEAWSIFPSAMACLVNEMSADEVFNVPLDYNQRIREPTQLHPDVAPKFAVLKEHAHISTRKMLLWMKTIGEDCNNVPEIVPSMSGRAPVGALKPKAGQCNAVFHATVRSLLDKVFLEQPRGYADFYDLVAGVTVEKGMVCKTCRQAFERGHIEMRDKWWGAVPKIMGFSGWEDERLWPAAYRAPAGDPPGEPYSEEGRVDPEGPLLY